MHKLSIILLLSLYLPLVHSQTVSTQSSSPSASSTPSPVIAVGEATIEVQKIALFEVQSDLLSHHKAAWAQVLGIIYKDLSYYKSLLEVVKSSQILNESKFPEGQNFSAGLFLKPEGSDAKHLRFSVKVMRGQQVLIQESFSWQSSDQLRHFAHQVADKIYESLFQKKSIFLSKIAFISDKASVSRKKLIKELYLMDFDGENVERLTHHNSIVLAPALSPDGKKLAYSLMASHGNVKNIDLYLMDLSSKTSRAISDKKGMNSGASFSSDGKIIYFTLSYQGNADVYALDLSTHQTRQITQHPSDDVDPSVSDDGSAMSFLSGRSGRSMIYVLDPRKDHPDNKENVRRITFTGLYNATPRFNPQGTQIVFASWLDRGFDLFRIDVNGQNLVRLSKDFGNNEEPSFSPDGQFIVFTSQRVISSQSATQIVYIMDKDGEIIGSILSDFGNCFSPRWSR